MRSALGLAFACTTLSLLPAQSPDNQYLEAAKLTRSGTGRASAFDIAIGGGVIAVGDAFTNSETGAVYLFEPGPSGWNSSNQIATLTASDGTGFDRFGHSVAIWGDTIVVGAWTADGINTFEGAVYVFERPSFGWVDMTETAKLKASEPVQNGYLGRSVAAGPGLIVAGATRTVNGTPGYLYVFEKPSSGWVNMTETAVLTASDGISGDLLGFKVALDGDTIVSGAFSATVGGNSDQGAVYVFEKPAGGWVDATETAKLTASDGTAFARFGTQVAIQGKTLVVTAEFGSATSPQFRGASYVFERPPTGWVDTTETAKLTPSATNDSDSFGDGLAIGEETIFVGAAGVGPTGADGAVFVYERPATGWSSTTETRALRSDDPSAALFGEELALSPHALVVMARGTPISLPQLQSGATYVFELATEHPQTGCASARTLLSGSQQIGGTLQLDMTACGPESLYAYFVGLPMTHPVELPRRLGCGSVLSCRLATTPFVVPRGRRPKLLLEASPHLVGTTIAVQGICDEPTFCVRITDMTTFVISN